MARRIFAIVLVVLGLGTIGAAIASGTIWRPDDRVTLALAAAPDVPVVITAPGVLDAVDDTVDVRVVAADPSSPVVIAMGRESDVRAWVADAPHWEITGLADWETLAHTEATEGAAPGDPTDDPTDATETTDGGEASESPSDDAEETETPSDDAETEAPGDDAEAEPLPDPAGSDLWVEEVTGTGEATYTWTSVPGRWVMLVATDGTQPAPQVELTWDREVETPFVQPGIILGSAVTLLGLALLVVQLLADLERRRARRAAARTAPEPVVTTTVEGDRPLTRREIRLAAEAARRGRKGRSGGPATTTDEMTAVGAESPSTVEASDDGTAAPETPPTASTPAEAGGDELAAWVRSGAASPLMHEGERTTPADLELGDEEPTPAAAPAPADAAGPDEGDDAPRRTRVGADRPQGRDRWWRRRRDDAAAPAETEQAEPSGSDQPDAGGSVPEQASPGPATGSGDTEQIPVVRPDDEPNPQTSGASWRETWGFGGTDHEREEER